MHSAAWENAKDKIVEVTGPAVAADVNPANRPNILFHFTDLTGVIGILESKSLWASLATSLNDPSEVFHALKQARSVIGSGQARADSVFLEAVERFLDPQESPDEYRLYWRPFVISFCARADRAVQWLHYGRSGTGAAVAFDPDQIQKDPFELFQVIYSEAQQDALIRSIIESAFDSLQLNISAVPGAEAADLADKAAAIAAQRIWSVASRFKSPAFSDEEEWRLIANDVTGKRVRPDRGVELIKHFRVVAGRVVPYTKLCFDPLSVCEIVLGASVPMPADDPAFAVLFESAGCRPRVTRSEVPVRQ